MGRPRIDRSSGRLHGVHNLRALLGLALALLRTSEFRLTGERLADGRAKTRILLVLWNVPAAVPLPLRAVLRFLRVSPESLPCLAPATERMCADDQSSCPRTSLCRLTLAEIRAIEGIVTSRIIVTSRPARLPSSPSDSARSGPRPPPSHTIPVVLADAGVENVNAQVDALIQSGVLRRLLAFTELKFSNSMIEAWWRSLKHQWLFLTRWITSPPCIAWSRSTSTNTTACCCIRRFADRRLTRCISAPVTACRQT